MGHGVGRIKRLLGGGCGRGKRIIVVRTHACLPGCVRWPNFFVEWAAQGPDDAKNIWAVYASFVATDKDTTSELLQEVTASDEGEEIALVI